MAKAGSCKIGFSPKPSVGAGIILKKGLELKAKKIIHNEKEQELEYFDVWMEMAGIPVMYAPYFWHPDPTVKRKSGFLAPSTGGSTYLGTTITTPYFYAISPSTWAK